MIGLVGTVYGMITAFGVIAIEGSSPQASQLASGISTALYSTLLGIAISIPAIFFYALYRNRIARLSLEVGMTAEPLLEQLRRESGCQLPDSALALRRRRHPHPFAVSAALAAAGPGPILRVRRYLPERRKLSAASAKKALRLARSRQDEDELISDHRRP